MILSAFKPYELVRKLSRRTHFISIFFLTKDSSSVDILPFTLLSNFSQFFFVTDILLIYFSNMVAKGMNLTIPPLISSSASALLIMRSLFWLIYEFKAVKTP